jgi:hypothetical protein
VFQGLEISEGAAEKALAIRVHPSVLPWGRGLAEHYTGFAVRSFVVRFQPTVATSHPGEVLIAPYYDAVDLSPNFSTNGSVDWLRDLPGMTAFQVWAEDSIAWLAKLATRAVFRIAGLTSPTTNSAEDHASTTPGFVYIAAQNAGSGNSGVVGNIIISYEIDFFTPKPASPTGALCLHSLATAGSDVLMLHDKTETLAMGDTSGYVFSGNTIQFRNPGVYTVVKVAIGTSSPQFDTDGDTLTSYNGTSKTFRHRTYDRTTSAYATSSTSLLHAESVAGTTTNMIQLYQVHAQIGDVLTLDAGSGGTFTNEQVMIFPAATMPFITVS